MRMNSPYYFCPMHAQIKSNQTGKCTICGMPLEPYIPEENIYFYDELNELKWRFWLASVLTVPLIFLHFFPSAVEKYIFLQWVPIIEFFIATIVVWVAGWPIISNAIRSFIDRKLNSFSLIGAGVLLAYIYSIAQLVWSRIASHPIQVEDVYGLYFETSAVITTIVLLGLLLEKKSERKTNQEINALMHLAPKLAHLVLPEEEERKIAIEDVKKGDVLLVKSSEKVPVDGTVKDGQTWINEMMVTGDSLPVFKKEKDKVIGGTLNGHSSFSMVAESVGSETILSQIIQLVTRARLTEAPLQIKTEKIVKAFIPFVLLFSLAVAAIWFFIGQPLPAALSYAIAILVIACPFAICAAIPVSMKVGISAGMRHGILIKDAEALEALEKATTLVIDKAGTLTENKPLLTKIFAPFPFSEQEVLKLGASVEANCSHPVAQAIVSGAKLKQLQLLPTADFQNVEGKGVIAYVDGTRVIVGNAKLLDELEIDGSELLPQAEKWQREGQTVSFVALEYRAIGLLAVADPIKFTAERAVHQLHSESLRVVMATGDSCEAANAVGKRLQIDEVEADVLPQDKLALVQRLQKQGHYVAMVGDAAKDGPAISQANVGIALGKDLFLQNPGVIVLNGDLCGVVRAINLSQAVMRNARQNLFIAYGYNLMALPLAAGILHLYFGLALTPIIASIAMVLCSLAVIGNALRLRYIKLFD